MLNQIRSIWSRRDLLIYFIRTDLKIIYRHKILGFLWTLLDPLLMMLIYLLLVVVIFRRGEPQFPVLLFSALLSWQWFTHSLTKSVTSITGKVRLIQSIYFPKIVLPLSIVFVGLINFFLGLIVLIPFLFIFEAKFTFNLLWMPVLILLQFLFTVGAAVLCATLGVYFRDLQNILRFGIRIWFYLSPALYSVKDRIPESLIPIYMINPFAVLFNSYKNILVRGTPPSIYIVIVIGLTILIFISSLTFFGRKEPYLAKDA